MRSHIRNFGLLVVGMILILVVLDRQVLAEEQIVALDDLTLSTPLEQPADSVKFANYESDAASGYGCGSPCNPWYIGVSGGWQHRETVHEVGDDLTFIEFSDGFLANAALGANLDWARMEFETTFMNNEVFRAGAGGASSPSPGNVNLRAYMFNIYRDFELENYWCKPYLGAGIGLYQSEINSLIPEFFNAPGSPLAGQPVNTTSDMPFAYQVRAGVSRPLGQHTEVFTGYRYFKGEELEFASVPFAQFAPTFHPDGAKIHALELGLRVNF